MQRASQWSPSEHRAGHALAGANSRRGLVGPEHWRIDASGVYVPAGLMVLLTVLIARRQA